MKRSFGLFFNVIFCLSLILGQVPLISAKPPELSFDTLTKGQKISGFRAEAIYLNDAGQPMGGRFIHERTGFTMDLLGIQSVPQTFIWVNSFPVSSQGEPHTQEHLLITKGNKGRNLNGEESMSMAQSNASTYQFYTVYHFNTSGGTEAFYDLFHNYMDALLHPDYSEEEVRREVCNWGVTENPDKTLRLEEKGSVYNEMTSSMDNPDARLFDTMGRLLFGNNSPLSYNAGGLPEGIRTMKADDIKRFHDANYHLGNMGAIVSVPKEMTLESVLTRTGTMLDKLEPTVEKRDYTTLENIPPSSPAEPGTIRVVDYPNKNEQQPGTMLFAYPEAFKISTTEKVLLDNFLGIFAGDANTNLYKKLVDTKTREIDLDAKGVYAYSDDLPGNPVYIGVTDVAAANLTAEKAEFVRQKLMAEFARVADFKDNSQELKEFNDRFASNLVNYRRNLSKFVDTPPGFGFRSGGSGYGWLWQTRYLNTTKDFRKSVTYKPEIAEIEKMLASGKNFWRDYIAQWRFAATKPYVTVAHPNASLVDQEAAAKKARADAQVAVLKKKYNVTNDQEAIRRYQAEYDANTAALEKLEQSSTGKFLENPPLTLDDQLDYKVSNIGSVPLVASTFDSMSSATTGLALRTDVIPENDLVYLSMMPALLRQVGVVQDGKAVSYENMSEMLNKEILSLNITFGGNYRTNRYEMVVRGAGNNTSESVRSIEWMKAVLEHPNWTKENLPRLRDVVDQQLSALRKTMQNPEEYWVNNPASAYLSQNSPVYLATQSSLTQAHNAQRLRWMFKDAGDAESQKAISGFLTKLAGANGSREDLQNLLAAIEGDKTRAEKIPAGLKPYYEDFSKLTGATQTLAVDAAKDLDQTLGDIPDMSLNADWSYLCNEINSDLAQTPEQTLAKIDSVRRKLLNNANSRMFFIGSHASQTRLEPAYKNLLANFETSVRPRIEYPKIRSIDERVKARNNTTANPVFVGLLAPNMVSGVFINAAPLASYKDTDRDHLLDYLASKIYGGSGAHSVYTKTLNAGLAYSNGVGGSPDSGMFSYYAERTPELPQTLRYIIDEIKKPYNDEGIGEYTIAQSFSSRSASPYEQRGEAMAANLADGITPELVTKFRRGILDLRKTPNLTAELVKRKDKVYATILPGYGIAGKDVTGANYFVIGGEKQMIAYEAYLKSTNNADSGLYRIYPSDYWLVVK